MVIGYPEWKELRGFRKRYRCAGTRLIMIAVYALPYMCWILKKRNNVCVCVCVCVCVAKVVLVNSIMTYYN